MTARILIAASLFMFGFSSGNENGYDAPYPELVQVWKATCPPGNEAIRALLTDEAVSAITNPVLDPTPRPADSTLPDDERWYFYCTPNCGVDEKTGNAKKHDCGLIVIGY